MILATGANLLVVLAIQSTLVLGAVALLTRHPSLARPAVREVAWKAALVGMLAGGLWVGTGIPGVAKGLSEGRAVIQKRVTRLDGEGRSWRADERIRLSRASAEAPRCRAVLLNGNPMSPARADAVQAACASWADALPLVVVLLWGLGAGVAVGRMALARHRLAGALGPRTPVSDREALAMLERLLCRVGLEQRVDLLIVRGLASPAVLGRRTLGLPPGLTEALRPAELEAVLAHEVAHLARRDPEVGWVVGGLSIVLWFQPLLGIARRDLRESGELACDALAARWTGRPRELARALAAVAEGIVRGSGPLPALTMVRRGNARLSSRIEALLDGSNAPLSRARAWILALVVALLTATAPAPELRLDPPPHVEHDVSGIVFPVI